MLALARRLAHMGPHGPPVHSGTSLPLLMDSLHALWQAPDVRNYSAGRGPGTVANEEFDEPEAEMQLPDMDTLRRLNPRLHEIMMQQQQGTQQTATAADTILEALQAASPEGKTAVRVNKTALRSMRVDGLRELLEQLGSDSRGSKEALVQRLMQLNDEEQHQQGEQQQAAVSRAAAAIKEGLVSRRQVAAEETMAQQLAVAAERGGYGVPEASLRDAHREMVGRAEFGDILTPEEVADIFADARADDVAIIDVRAHCAFTDWMVLATVRSQRLAHMLAAAVLHRLKAQAKEVAPGVVPTIEGGLHDSEWLVVDAGSVVAHVFLDGYRQEYALEELWGLPDGSNIRRVAPRQTVHTLDSLTA